MSSQWHEKVAKLALLTAEERKERYNAIRAAKTQRLSVTVIHPDAINRDYSDREMEFLMAVDEWKQINHKQFPTLHDMLEVIDALGYKKETP